MKNARSAFRKSVSVVYAGGFLGPFAASLSAAIIPELGGTFGVSNAQATLAVPVYLVPFASLMLISGALGRRFGITRTTTTAFLLLIPTSVGSALAPTWVFFLVSQALAGALNAFTTPLLLATLGMVTRADRLGRALGLFASLQSLGLLCGPLVSGIAAVHSWRAAFVTVALLATGLVVLGIPTLDAERASWRSLFGYFTTRWVYLLATMTFVVGMCVNGLVPIVVLHSVEQWNLDSASRGLLVMSGGVAAMLVSAPVGRLLDQHGPYRVAAWSVVVALVVLLPAPFATQPWLFAGWWFLASGAAQATVVALMTALMQRPGAASAISVFQGARFGGVALGPVVFVPLYAQSVVLVFAASLVGLILVLAILPLVLGQRGRIPEQSRM